MFLLLLYKKWQRIRNPSSSSSRGERDFRFLIIVRKRNQQQFFYICTYVPQVTTHTRFFDKQSVLLIPHQKKKKKYERVSCVGPERRWMEKEKVYRGFFFWQSRTDLGTLGIRTLRSRTRFVGACWSTADFSLFFFLTYMLIFLFFFYDHFSSAFSFFFLLNLTMILEILCHRLRRRHRCSTTDYYYYSMGIGTTQHTRSIIILYISLLIKLFF